MKIPHFYPLWGAYRYKYAGPLTGSTSERAGQGEAGRDRAARTTSGTDRRHGQPGGPSGRHFVVDKFMAIWDRIQFIRCIGNL